MKIIVFVTHLYLVISCSASVYEADVSAALQSDVLTFTNKPGLLTAILMEVDKRGITELPWSSVNINGTTLSHQQDTESLGKLVGRFSGSEETNYLASSGTNEQVMVTDIYLLNTNNVGSVMVDIINNITQLKVVDHILVHTDWLYTGLLLHPLDGDNTQRYVKMFGFYGSSSLTSTLTRFTERLEYDGEVGTIELHEITQSEVSEAAVLDILWERINTAGVELSATHPSVVFSTSLLSGVLETPQPWRKLYLSPGTVPLLTATDRSTIDQMRMNGVLDEDLKVEFWLNGRRKKISWLPNIQQFDWTKLRRN